MPENCQLSIFRQIESHELFTKFTNLLVINVKMGTETNRFDELNMLFDIKNSLEIFPFQNKEHY